MTTFLPDDEPNSSHEWQQGEREGDADDQLVDPKDVEPEDNPFDRRDP